MRRHTLALGLLLGLSTLMPCHALDQNDLVRFNSEFGELLWPLCGRWKDDGYNGEAACPSSRWSLHDLPIHHGYGPRNFSDDSRDVSWHRGIDIQIDSGAPVFAAQCGFVKKVVNKPDGEIIIRHLSGMTRTNEGKCQKPNDDFCANEDNLGRPTCVYTRYAHLKEVEEAFVSNGDFVQKGARIGLSGKSGSDDGNFAHLHFEVRWDQMQPLRDNIGVFTSRRVAKDAVNPMSFLPICQNRIDNAAITFTRRSDGKVVPTLTLESPWSESQQNLRDVHLFITEKPHGGEDRRARMPAERSFESSLSVDYRHNPAVLDFEKFNANWTPIACNINTNGTTWDDEQLELPYEPANDIDHQYPNHPKCPSNIDEKLESKPPENMVTTPVPRTIHYNNYSLWTSDHDSTHWQLQVTDHGLADFDPKNGCVNAQYSHVGADNTPSLTWGCGLQVFSPGPRDPVNSDWSALVTAQANVTVDLGSLTGINPANPAIYGNAMAILESGQVRTVASIFASANSSPIPSVQSQIQALIDDWEPLGLDGVHVRGIGFDCTAETHAYYQALDDQISAIRPDWLIMVSPHSSGLPASADCEEIMNYADVVRINFWRPEEWATSWQQGVPAGYEWTQHDPASRFAGIIRGYDPITDPALGTLMQSMKDRNFGYALIHDSVSVTPEPDAKNAVWLELLSLIKSSNDNMITDLTVTVGSN